MSSPALDRFQLEAVDFFDSANGRVIYADPMGARKTGTTLSWLAHAPVGHTLVVAPSSVLGHWVREAARFYPEAPAQLYRGTPLKREQMRWRIPSEHDLWVTTYGTLAQDSEHLAGRFDAVVFDEGHRLKGRTNIVAKAANTVTAKATHIICATGTPMLNHPHELWQYLHMIDRQRYTSFWRWVESYFIVEMKQFKGRREPTRIIHGFISDAHEARLREELKGVMIQRELHEMFDVNEHPWIVEPDHVVVPVELSPAERKAYKKMADDFWARLPGGQLINAGNKLVATSRLQHFASDWGVMDATMPNGAKVVAATEYVGDLARRKPVIVFAKYKETVQRLATALSKDKVRAYAWTGDVNPAGREELLRMYAAGKVDVLAGTIASLGEGVDGLQYRTNQVVMLDRDWRPGINDQAIGRVRRSGQTERVVVHHLFNEDTIDESIHETNLRKVNFEQALKGQDLKQVLYGRITFANDIEIEVQDD